MIPHGAYNPSIVRFGKDLIYTCRAHDREDWRTNLYAGFLNDNLVPISCEKIIMDDDIEQNSQEDARLWVHEGKLMMSWTISQWPATIFRAVMCYSELQKTPEGWTAKGRNIPSFGKNNFSGIEKNWSFISHPAGLYCIYSTNETEQAVIKLNGSSAETVLQGSVLSWKHGPVHGGSVAPHLDGKLIHFFNSRTGGEERNKHRYHIGCAILDGNPPFNMVGISKKPILSGEEGARVDNNVRFKPNVVFPCGAIKNGDGWLLAYGWNDCECRIARLTVADLNL